MTDPICFRDGCNNPVLPYAKESPSHRDRRKYCSLQCANRATAATRRKRARSPERTNQRTADRLENIQYLLDTHESPDLIANRLGISKDALARWCRKHDQPHLAIIFERKHQPVTNSQIGKAKHRMSLFPDMPDMKQAACKGENPELFFYSGNNPERKQVETVRRICGNCVERAVCLNFAVDTYQAGLWAGTTDVQRKDLRRQRNQRPIAA